MHGAAWEDAHDLVVRCLRDAKALYQDGEWSVTDAERAAARATGLTGPELPAFDYPAVPTRDVGDPLARPAWLQQAAHAVQVASALRAAAAPLPQTGPLPMLLAAVADLCDQLRPDTERLEAQWAADDPGAEWEAWDLSHVPNSLWSQTIATINVISRLSRFLGSMLLAD
ncbi:hypothetical protein [Streptomyces phytophilus]|uniref:hypothetical protein n=1 Tax=Streptomyces phytophilus TaxID=722715 RepID=UPI0015EFE3A9|nr:hypothetical protein [Streptomyces phytophilus]